MFDRCDFQYLSQCSSCEQTYKMDVNFKEDPVFGSVGEILIKDEFELTERTLLDSIIQWRCKAYQTAGPVSLKTTVAGSWNIQFYTIIKDKEATDKPYVDPEYWKYAGFKPYYVPEEPNEVFLVEEGEEIEESWITGLHLYFF